jgi:hypothetical protein
MLHRTQLRLDRSGVTVSVDVGRHDSLSAEPTDVLAEDDAWLSTQLEFLRGHMYR